MSDTPKLLLQKDGPIGWIIFNQPLLGGSAHGSLGR